MGYRAVQPSILALPGDHEFKAEPQEEGGLGHFIKQSAKTVVGRKEFTSFSPGIIFG